MGAYSDDMAGGEAAGDGASRVATWASELSTFWQITLGAVAVVLITAALSLVGVDTWLGVIVGAAIVGLAVGWLTRRAEQL